MATILITGGNLINEEFLETSITNNCAIDNRELTTSIRYMYMYIYTKNVQQHTY